MTEMIREIEKLTRAWVDLDLVECAAESLDEYFGDDPSRVAFYISQNDTWSVELWYNDMFGLALSWCMVLFTGEQDKLVAIRKVRDWLDDDRILSVFARFDGVRSEDTERYFYENNLIRADLEVLINRFNGFPTEGAESA